MLLDCENKEKNQVKVKMGHKMKIMSHKNEISYTKKKAIRVKMFSMTWTLLQKTKEKNNFIL